MSKNVALQTSLSLANACKTSIFGESLLPPLLNITRKAFRADGGYLACVVRLLRPIDSWVQGEERWIEEEEEMEYLVLLWVRY